MNRGPLRPERSALAKLRYAPTTVISIHAFREKARPGIARKINWYRIEVVVDGYEDSGMEQLELFETPKSEKPAKPAASPGETAWPTPSVMLVQPHPDIPSTLVEESWGAIPAIYSNEYRDSFNNRRADSPQGLWPRPERSSPVAGGFTGTGGCRIPPAHQTTSRGRIG